ncbi:MAG: phosphatase [Bacteroidetes bacterium]|nr:MAG: phosphatase [Bacteroidota bacterium]
MKAAFLNKIDRSWTLFLDRDGVINHETEGDYVTNWSEFHFYDGVKDAMTFFATIFNRIILVTNQRGVSKGLMDEADLKEIHLNMLGALESHGGRIDRIYYCTDLDDISHNRKPNPGMGLQAKKDFPEIDFNKAIMIGNTMGDMQFGKNIGTYTIFISSNRPAPVMPNSLVDAVYPTLISVAKDIRLHTTQR